LIFKSTREENVNVIGLPSSALGALEVHRRRQDEFRAQFGSDYRKDLNLIFANPDGTPLNPDSISATVSVFVQTSENSKAEKLIATSPAALSRQPHAGEWGSAAGSLKATRAFLSADDGRYLLALPGR
jgi:hypothetical protein